MKVLLGVELFEPGSCELLDLVALFRMGADGRHVVLPEPLDSPELEEWLGGLPLRMKEEIRFSIELGLETESREPRLREARIHAGREERWDAVPRLPLETALDWLGSPMTVLVENARNDKAFVRCLADPHQRKALDQAEERGRLRFEHGGGLPEMAQTVNEWKHQPSRRHRGFLFFDSDALAPGYPSEESRKLARSCRRKHVDHCQLRRRAAENYLPSSLLEPPSSSVEEKRRARAFGRLEKEQRHHFNMKQGLAGDTPRLAQEGKGNPRQKNAVAARERLFGGLTEETRMVLQGGFGRKLATRFDSGEALSNYSWFVQDGGAEELRPVIDRLLRLL